LECGDRCRIFRPAGRARCPFCPRGPCPARGGVAEHGQHRRGLSLLEVLEKVFPPRSPAGGHPAPLQGPPPTLANAQNSTAASPGTPRPAREREAMALGVRRLFSLLFLGAAALFAGE